MMLQPSKEHIAFKHECEQFARDEIATRISELEESTDALLKLYQKMSQRGLFSILLNRDALSNALAMSAIAYADAGISVAMSVTNMVAEAIHHYGTEDQKNRYLPMPERPSAFALTEKDSGSDAKSIQTEAIEESEGRFRITGEKQFISNGDLAGVILLFCKTGDGITAFLIDKGTEGVSVTKTEKKLGLLTAHLVDLKFDHVHVDQSQILGPLNDGFKIAMSSLDSGRISIAAQALGIAEAAFHAALDRAQHRVQFGKPIAEFEAIRFKLADMHVKLSAGKLLLYKACALKEEGLPYTLEASEAKLFCSEAANEIANEALQIFGGYGYLKDYPAEKYFRDARVTTLYEGTSEIQRLVIAKSLLT